MLKDIEEALEKRDYATGNERFFMNQYIGVNAVDWLRHLLSIISQKDEEIERLTSEIMKVPEGESPC